MHWVNSWLWKINEVVPPFCVEIVFRDGTRHQLHSVLGHDKESDTGVIRIWDMRAFTTEGELEDLKHRLKEIRDRSELNEGERVHPKLDWANVYLHVDDVAYCIEWHDRLWPEQPTIGYSAGAHGAKSVLGARGTG